MIVSVWFRAWLKRHVSELRKIMNRAIRYVAVHPPS
jgi:hypothetical protein